LEVKAGGKWLWRNHPWHSGLGRLIFSHNNIPHFAGKPIAISPSCGCLYPAITINGIMAKANFGDNPAEPFKYNIGTCPGIVFNDYDEEYEEDESDSEDEGLDID
jgi:hypothetical protein